MQRNGKESNVCVSRTTLSRKKNKICMQLFIEIWLFGYKFRFAVEKQKQKILKQFHYYF